MGGFMDKLAMISIIIATAVVPAIAARDPNGQRALRRMMFFLLVFNALYLAYVTMVHAPFYAPERW